MHLGLRVLPRPSGSSRQEAATWVSVQKPFLQLQATTQGSKTFVNTLGSPLIAALEQTSTAHSSANTQLLKMACGCPRSVGSGVPASCFGLLLLLLSHFSRVRLCARQGNAIAISATLMHNLPVSSSLLFIYSDCGCCLRNLFRSFQ